MPMWLSAGLWGGLAGGALLIGALIGCLFPLKQRVVAAVMAFGSGVLISALSFELMAEAYETGGFISTALGFVAGSVIYTVANLAVNKFGAKHRKRSAEGTQPSENEQEGSGLAIAVGALIDGVPESIVVGVSLLEGGAVSLVTVAAIFISNIPEGLSSSAGMKKSGRSLGYILGIWGGIAAISAIAAVCGFVLFEGASPSIIALTMAVAAGAILTMIVDTMIPEAFAETHDYAGLITVLGFLTAFALERII